MTLQTRKTIKSDTFTDGHWKREDSNVFSALGFGFSQTDCLFRDRAILRISAEIEVCPIEKVVQPYPFPIDRLLKIVLRLYGSSPPPLLFVNNSTEPFLCICQTLGRDYWLAVITWIGGAHSISGIPPYRMFV